MSHGSHSGSTMETDWTAWGRSPEWDSADGGISVVNRRRRPKEIQTREAEEWIMNTKESVATPTTQASTPSPSHKGDSPIPETYRETIVAAFGPDADLYQLLDVDRNASDRDIRIAYFRRGRQVLTDSTNPNSSAAMTIGGVSQQSKLRFQAVSMAYEILSNPEWRESYEKTGLVGRDDTEVQYFDSRSIPNSPVSTSSHTKRTGVRWNEEVEELVFDQDPSEFSLQDDSEYGVCGDEERPPKEKKKKKKKKKRVVVEDSGNLLLEDQLAKLDEVADRDLFNDFLDDLEASIDGLLSLGSRSSKGSKEKVEVPPPPGTGSIQAALVENVSSSYEEQEARSPVATTEKSVESTPSRSNFPKEEHHERPKERHYSAPFELQLPDITRESNDRSPKKSTKHSTEMPPRDIVINPEDVEVQPPSNIAFTLKSQLDPLSHDSSGDVFDNTDDTTISTISNTTFGVRKSQEPKLVEPPKLEKVAEVDAPFVDCPMDEDPSPPSSEWLNKTREPLLDVEAENDADVEVASNNAKASDVSTVATSDIEYCKALCTDSDSPTRKAVEDGTPQQGRGAPPQDMDLTRMEESDGFVSDFIFHLFSYVKAMTDEVGKFGESLTENPPSLLEGLVLGDDDLENFFGILKTELNRSPQDLA